MTTTSRYLSGHCGPDRGPESHRRCTGQYAGTACTRRCGHRSEAPTLDERPTAVSLFAGVEGIGLAVERAGWRVVAAVEKDPAARGVIADQMPHIRLFHDVTEVTGDQLRAVGFVARGGILTAGWPCQDNSVAGRRAGMAGPRSGLWVHVARLLAELRPTWFLGENVPGLLSVNDGHDFAQVVQDVADVVGMGCAWRVLDAQHFGVPQRRRRVFIVGCTGNRAAPVEVLFEPEGVRGDPAPGGQAGPRVAALTASSAGSGCGADDNDAQGGRLIVSTLMAGSPTSYRAGPDEAAAGHLVVTTLTTNSGASYDDQQLGQLIPIAFDAAQVTSPDNRTACRPGGPAPALAATGRPTVAHTLTANPQGGGRRQEDDYNVVAHTLSADGADGADASEDGTGRGTPLVVDGPYEVRRLTPTECERLQGMPDGWTSTSNGRPQADSPRYRQIGNSVAVPVVEWVARRIAAVAESLGAAA